MKRAIAALLVLALLRHAPVYARTCMIDDRPLDERVAEAKAEKEVIFRGRAIMTDYYGTLFSVDRAWTPGLFRTLFVYTSNYSETFYFDKGRYYTVFARSSSNGQMWSTSCGLSTDGFPQEYSRALGPGYVPPQRPDYTALWLEIGGTIWLATFVFLRIRRREQPH